MRINTRTVLSVLAAGALLCAGGCGSKNEPGKTLIKPRAVVKIAPADTLSPNMVAAVTVTKGAASTVQVKFELGGRPQVGQPLDVDLVIVPVAILDRISGKVQGEDGLTVVRGAVIPVTDKPAPGAPIRHSLKVLPGRDGMFT
ncbi:MAG: hypothetical protein ACRETH_02085, partial [Steroidobacteraceae bacterium]